MIEGQRPEDPYIAFEKAWEDHGRDDLARLTGWLPHERTDNILSFMEDHRMSLPAAVATCVTQIDAPLYAQGMQQDDPLLPAELVRVWYGHPSAFLLKARPPYAQREMLALPNVQQQPLYDDLEAPFKKVEKYEGETTDSDAPLQQVKKKYLDDPTGEEAVNFVATDPNLKAARSLSEAHPTIVETVVSFGRDRYHNLMIRMLKELDPRLHPGAADQAELSENTVAAQRQKIVASMWEEDVKPYIHIQRSEPVNQQYLTQAAFRLLQRHHAFPVIHDTLTQEVDELSAFCEDNVAHSFPRSDLLPKLLTPVQLLLQTRHSDADVMREYKQQMIEQSGIIPTRTLVDYFDARANAHLQTVKQMQRITRRDPSGFAGLHFYLSDPTEIAKREKWSTHPMIDEDVLHTGAQRYADWYLQLASLRLVPFPSSSTPYFNH